MPVDKFGHTDVGITTQRIVSGGVTLSQMNNTFLRRDGAVYCVYNSNSQRLTANRITIVNFNMERFNSVKPLEDPLSPKVRIFSYPIYPNYPAGYCLITINIEFRSIYNNY